MQQIIIAALASSVIAALINQVGNAIQWKRQRAAAKEDNSNILMKGMMALLLDRLQHLCKAYIDDGAVDLDDRRRLHIMHECYHKLGGNGDLDTLMHSVDKLPLK